MKNKLVIRQMQRPELDTLINWAAAEGWNPGLFDTDIFWATDPQGFIAAEVDGELIGGGSIVSYQGKFGFMGFFIVKPEYRGQSLGAQLWYARRDKLSDRLNAGAAIGMDGVFDMQNFYARGGFQFSHRQIRYTQIATSSLIDPQIIPASQVDFAQLQAYDKQCFPADRATFLTAWFTQSEGLALAYQANNTLLGYGVIRRCRQGYKIGPLFADSPTIAEALFNGLSNHAAKQPIFLDVPENNSAALALAKQHNMQEVFGCARMYFGDKPALDESKIYGVTTFELG